MVVAVSLMRLIACEQGSAEWLQARCGIATASCFAQIMAEGRKKGEEAVGRRILRHRLALERLRGIPLADGFDSFALRQGREREPDARLAYEVATGRLVQQVGFCRHDTIEAGCSPDGLIGEDEGLEIKSPEPHAHLAVLESEQIPGEYRWQVQGGLWITGRLRWTFVSYNPDFPDELQLAMVVTERNRDDIDRLAAEVEVFMQEVEREADRLRELIDRKRRRG